MKAFVRIYAVRYIWVIMAVGGLHSTADCSYAQHKIFDANVIEKWKAYEAFSHGLQGISRAQVIRNGKSQKTVKEYKQNSECSILIGPNNRDPLLLTCALANPRYRAIINYGKSDLSNAVLQKYTPLPSSEDNILPSELVFYEASRHFAYNRSSSLRQAVSEPSFKVIKVNKEKQNGEELIRIDHVYNYSSTSANQTNHRVREQGSLWLDPSRCWCIRRFKVSIEATTGSEPSANSEEEIVCETIDHPSGFPILKSKTENVKLFSYRSKQKIDVSTKIDYDLERFSIALHRNIYVGTNPVYPFV